VAPDPNGSAGFPPSREQTTSMRMPSALWERARRYAFEHYLSFNEMLSIALEQALDREKQASADKRIP